MDYVKLVSNFWVQHHAYCLTYREVALYFYLLHISELLKGKQQFRRNNRQIMSGLQLSFRPLNAARNNLKEIGLIDFTLIPHSHEVIYTLLEISHSASGKSVAPYPTLALNNAEVSEQVSCELSEQVSARLNKTKYKTKTKTNNTPVIPLRGVTANLDYSEILNLFNESFAGKLSQIKSITPKRRSAIKARVSEHGIDSVKEVFQKVTNSPFLLGVNARGWKCDFDWIFKPSCYIKILEGNYQNSYYEKEQQLLTEQLNQKKYEEF